MNNNDALSAINDLKEAQTSYGSTVTFRHQTEAVYDDITYELITPATNEDFQTKMFVESSATDKIIAKLTDNESSYSLYLSGYFPQDLNKEDWEVIFKGDTYSITFIDKFILQDTLVSYDILVKK